MKKVLTICLLVLMVVTVSMAQDDPRVSAEQIIKAYQTKNTELLKEKLTGIMKYAVTENFFESHDAEEGLAIINSWDGEIKGVKYGTDKIMGKNVKMALFLLSEGEEDKLNVVITTSTGNGWFAFSYGVTTMPRSEYEGFSDTMEDAASEMSAKKDHRKFTIENALGEIKKEPTNKDLTDMLAALSDDNFFLTLSHETDGFIQSAYSADGYSVEYRDSTGYFGASRLLTLEETQKLFCDYIDGAINWKDGFQWENLE